MKHLVNYQSMVGEGKLTFVANLENADVLSISIIMSFITWPLFEADITRADWLIVGHYSPVMPKGRINIYGSTNKAKGHVIKNLFSNLKRSVFTGKSQTSALKY